MIIANLATYPPRRAGLRDVIRRIAPQVDRINVVLNQYEYIPKIEDIPDNVQFNIPISDLKDTGKFFPRTNNDDYIFLIDDDILYPSDYVQVTMGWLKKLNHQKVIVGFHGSIYTSAGNSCSTSLDRNVTADSASDNEELPKRSVMHFSKNLEREVVVHQLGSGVCAMRASELPPFSYMVSSQKFVDIRMAWWACQNDIEQICLPRSKGWLKPIHYPETIYNDFTRKMPMNVVVEVKAICMAYGIGRKESMINSIKP